MQRLGLFGGSFDPIHLGHLLVAQAAREELKLTRLYFIPAARSPFKPSAEPAAAKERLRLLRLALAGNAWSEIDEQELNRGGVSFSIETVRQYAKQYPEAKLFYLIGTDHVSQLHKWREAEALAELTEFVAISRPGEAEIPFRAPFRGHHLKGFPLAVSSSQIRARVKAGCPILHLVPPRVDEAIRNNRLYL